MVKFYWICFTRFCTVVRVCARQNLGERTARTSLLFTYIFFSLNILVYNDTIVQKFTKISRWSTLSNKRKIYLAYTVAERRQKRHQFVSAFVKEKDENASVIASLSLCGPNSSAGNKNLLSSGYNGFSSGSMLSSLSVRNENKF